MVPKANPPHSWCLQWYLCLPASPKLLHWFFSPSNFRLVTGHTIINGTTQFVVLDPFFNTTTYSYGDIGDVIAYHRLKAPRELNTPPNVSPVQAVRSGMINPLPPKCRRALPRVQSHSCFTNRSQWDATTPCVRRGARTSSFTKQCVLLDA